MELKDHREEGRSEPQGRGKSRREERDDGPVEERAPSHAQRPRGPADFQKIQEVSRKFSGKFPEMPGTFPDMSSKFPRDVPGMSRKYP